MGNASFALIKIAEIAQRRNTHARNAKKGHFFRREFAFQLE